MIFDLMSVEVTCVTLLKDHCVQVPWEYSNACGYSDQFCKIPHTYLHTYYIQLVHTTYRMSDHIVSFWTRSGETKMTYNYYFLGLFSPPPHIFSHLYAKPCQILNPVIWNFACILITQVTCQRWFWITSYYLCTGSTGWQHVGLHLKVMKQIKLVSYIFILT